MSLINQMLRDLQQQKNDGGSVKSDTWRSRKMVRVPSLPLPLVLGGAALGLLFFVWWLAGALSDLMFGFEPTGKLAASQQVVATESSLTAEKPMAVVEAQDQLTEEERLAEPPVAPVVSDPPVVSEQVVEKVRVIVNAQPAQKPPVAKVPVIKPIAVKPTSAVAKPSPLTVTRHKVVAVSSRVTPKNMSVKNRPVPTPHKVIAKAPKRLHPDNLPGAILSSSRNPPATKSIVPRSSESRATTPYGMAEEAFLGGKWALEQQRGYLAVRSLQHALDLYAGHLPARELLVEILGKEGKTGEAMFLLAEGLEIAPDYAAFKKRYTRMLVDQGDYDAATKVMLNGGLPTVENDPEAHVVLASLYQRLGESFLAAQTYRNLLVSWPQTGAFWVGLGGALEGQNLPEEAGECYKRALKTKNLRQDLRRYAKNRLNLPVSRLVSPFR